MRKPIGAIAIIIGLAGFVPGIHGLIYQFSVVHLVPPYGVAAVTGPYATVMIRGAILLAQLLFIAGGILLLVLRSRRTEEPSNLAK